MPTSTLSSRSATAASPPYCCGFARTCVQNCSPEPAGGHERVRDRYVRRLRHARGSEQGAKRAVADEQRLVERVALAQCGEGGEDGVAAQVRGDRHEVRGERLVERAGLQGGVHERETRRHHVGELVDELPLMGGGEQRVGKVRGQPLPQIAVDHIRADLGVGDDRGGALGEHDAHHVVLQEACDLRHVADV